MKELGLFRPGPSGLSALATNGTLMCRGHGVPVMVTGSLLIFKLDTKWYSDVPWARSTREDDTGYLLVFKLHTFWYIDVSGTRSTGDGETGNLSLVLNFTPCGTLMCRGHGVPEMVKLAIYLQFQKPAKL